jgi:hypothetical protein
MQRNAHGTTPDRAAARRIESGIVSSGAARARASIFPHSEFSILDIALYHYIRQQAIDRRFGKTQIRPGLLEYVAAAAFKNTRARYWTPV